MARIEITPQARQDLDDIWDYIAQDSPTNANRFLDRLQSAMENLAPLPYSGVSRPQLGENVRVRTVGNYLICYEPLPDGVRILHVIWGGRDDIESLFRDE